MLFFTKDSNYSIVKGIDNTATQDYSLQSSEKEESWIGVSSFISWSPLRKQSVFEKHNQMGKEIYVK